jgi:aminoglycoside phosphotransferase (APT) family kinase protein
LEDLPWSKDRKLTPEMVRELVRAQFPEVGARVVQKLGEGWDFEAFDINNRWVFRFPKRKNDCDFLLWEWKLLEEIFSLLPIPVPHYEFRGQPSDDFPYYFGGYAKLPGRQAQGLQLPAAAIPGVAATIGRFLRSLHSINPVLAHQIAKEDADGAAAIANGRKEVLEELPLLEAYLGAELCQHCQRFFQDEMNRPEEYTGPGCLVHGDLQAEHILIDADTCEITGMIDWSDAYIGDPAEDFAGLWTWQGEELLEATIQCYGLPVDESMRQRIRYKGLVQAVGNADWARVTGQEPYLEQSINCLCHFFAC